MRLIHPRRPPLPIASQIEGSGDDDIDTKEQGAAGATRCSRREDQSGGDGGSCHPDDLHRAKAERERVDGPGEERDHRDQ